MKTYKTLLLSFMVILFAFVGCDIGNSSNSSSERCIVMYDNEEIPCDFHEVETAVDFLDFLYLEEGTDFIIEGNKIKLLNEYAYTTVTDYIKDFIFLILFHNFGGKLLLVLHKVVEKSV